MLAQNVLELIGNTPLVEIRTLNPNPRVKIYAKLEFFNPGGSIKDRVALAMIERAERLGEISREKVIIEATSGNTGIGLAMVCAVKGYRLMLLMPDSASEERKRIMRAYGADIYLTPGHLATDGAIEEAYRLAREEGDKYVLMDQFNNPASIDAHYHGTGMEIWEQTGGKVTHVIAALGTSGTAMGISKRLKELNSDIQIIAIEPYIGHSIQGLKNMQASYPPGIFNRHCLDKIMNIDDETAFETCRRLCREEGIFAGMSSGAALAGAIKVAEELEEGLIVVIFPDGGERYLSTPLFLHPKKQGIFVYNIKTKEKDLLCLDDKLSLYTFGPSAEAIDDLEVWRRIILLDVLGGYLKYKGADFNINIGVPDLDDQAVCCAQQMEMSLKKFSDYLVENLIELGKKFFCEHIKFIPASKEIDLMVSMTEKVLDRGKGYEKLRSVYFDVSRDREYGKMVGADLNKLLLGKTVDLENYVKENPRDFTLLKRASLQDLKTGDFIKTRWGNVRPSWYMQMAASIGRGKKRLDLVIGGSTHYFPHMENLQAIWKYGLNIDVNIWMIVGKVQVEDHLIPNLSELTRLTTPQTIRMFFLSQSYHKPLFVSEENIKMWEKNQERVQQCAANVYFVKGDGGEVKKELEQIIYDLKRGFSAFIEDDLKVYKFWPVLFEFCKKVNGMFFKRELTPKEASLIWDKLKDIASILRIVDNNRLPLKEDRVSPEIRELVKKREELKLKKEFKKADGVRDILKTKGYLVEDTPYGQRVFKI